MLILIPEYHQSPTGLFIASPRFLNYFLYDQQIFRNLTVFKKKGSGGSPSALFSAKSIHDTIRTEMTCCLAESNTDQPIFHHVGIMTIDIEGHSFVISMGGCCSEVWCYSVIAPVVTFLETVRVTRNKKPRVEFLMTNQQLIGVILVYSLSVPQSEGTC